MSTEKDIKYVREQLHKAAEIRDPKQMWYVLRDILILLAMIVEPTPELVPEEPVVG